MKIRNLILITFLLCAVNIFAHTEKDTIYVSTMGLKIKIVNEVISSNSHSLYKITDNRQKDILFSSMYNFSIKEDPDNKMMIGVFMKLLDARDFDKEVCYVLVTSLTRNMEISLPFYLINTNDLLFPLKEAEPKIFQYVYLRIYVVKIEDDIMNKYLLKDNEKTILEPIIL